MSYTATNPQTEPIFWWSSCSSWYDATCPGSALIFCFHVFNVGGCGVRGVGYVDFLTLYTWSWLKICSTEKYTHTHMHLKHPSNNLSPFITDDEVKFIESLRKLFMHVQSMRCVSHCYVYSTLTVAMCQGCGVACHLSSCLTWQDVKVHVWGPAVFDVVSMSTDISKILHIPGKMYQVKVGEASLL